MSGCLHLTEWQVQDLEMSRRRAELLTARVGASLLCEDSSNFTTCVCNRRDKCNDIHARNPFSTYTGNVFGGIINFDSVIGNIDPRYRDIFQTRSSGTGYRRAYTRSSSTSQRLSCALSVFMLLCSILL
uniref:RGM_N domain-containing protein n=1 Tax=Steinernema glaseri TaxID=37863 RepID=A0A1I8A9U7_9BILA